MTRKCCARVSRDALARVFANANDAVEQRGQDGGVDGNARSALRDVVRKSDDVLVEPLREQAPTRRVAPQQLQQVASSIHEDEHRALGERVAT